MLVTNEFIISGMSRAGGWNRAQLELIGVPWPPVQGWKWRAIGRVIPDADADLFLAMRGKKSGEIKRLREGTLTLFAGSHLKGRLFSWPNEKPLKHAGQGDCGSESNRS